MERNYQYLVGQIQQALAADPRVSMLDVKVMVCGGKIHLTGEIATEERRQAISEVVAAMMPDHEVRNELTIIELNLPHRPEVIND